MTIFVGIFDNPKDPDETIVKLADQGFEDTVFDESIVAQEMGFPDSARSTRTSC